MNYFGEEPDPLRPLDWDEPVRCEACGAECQFSDLLVSYHKERFLLVCPNPGCPASPAA